MGAKLNCFKKKTKPQEMEGLSLPRRKAKQFKKETKPQAMQRLSLCGSGAKLFQKRKQDPRTYRG
jgi:hypothetical protein